MRKIRQHTPAEDEPIVDISSLIDVCFLLLIYFIVTSTIAEKETDLMLRLPVPGANSQPEIDPAFFSIDQNGAISEIELDKSTNLLTEAGDPNITHRLPTQMPELMARLQLYASINKDKAMVKLQVHENTPTQYVVDMMNALQSKNISNITFTKF